MSPFVSSVGRRRPAGYGGWPGTAGWIGYVVDPARRRRGYATAMISHLIVLPELEDVEMFTAGVEPDNVASVRALSKAGFHALRVELDPEGIMYFVWRRDAESVC